MRKKKPLPIIENVEIVDVAAEGKSIAKIDDMVVFIPYGAPGDIVDIKLDKKKKSFAEAHIERMVRPSEIRSHSASILECVEVVNGSISPTISN